MDSDSDHFESADEELHSDDEHQDKQTLNKPSQKEAFQNRGDEINTQVRDTSLDDYKKPDDPEEKTLEPSGVIILKKDCDNKSDDFSQKLDKIEVGKPKPVRKERTQKIREPKPKLGTKLGTKLTDKFTELPPSTEQKVSQDQFSLVNNDLRTDVQEKLSSTGKAELKTEVPVVVEKESIKIGEDDDIFDSWGDETADNWVTVSGKTDESKLYSQKTAKEENFWDNEADYMEIPQNKNEHVEDVLDKLSPNKEQNSWSGWGNWGVTSLLSTASLGVSSITNSVSQGISTVLETGIGAPDPEELARLNLKEKEKKIENETEKILKNKEESEIRRGFGLGHFVSGVTHITKLVETTGTKVLSGGLDTLEVIGKKTMEVLQEGDPGLKKKRALLGLNEEKTALSQLLREAKEKAEEEDKFLEQCHFTKKPHFETLFDDHQGLVHLEALEMLSKQCDIKLETMLETCTGNTLTDIQETMTQIKELCELPDEDEDNETSDVDTIREKLTSAVDDLNVKITYDHLLIAWSEMDEWLKNLTECDPQDVHEKGIETLAKLTAVAVEQFHKAGELLLVKERRSTVDEADSLVQLTTTLTSLVGMAAGKFSEKLNSLEKNASQNSENVNNLITNIFLEAANSSAYIQDAFQLLIPVLQVGAV